MEPAILLKLALEKYGMDFEKVIIEKQLLPDSDHGDPHYQIKLDGTSYSARFLRPNRYAHEVFLDITDEVLIEQMRFGRFLRDAGYPFMRNRPAANGDVFIHLEIEGETWRFVLHEWLEGEHLTHGSEKVAETFGRMARQLHDLSSRAFASEIFLKQSHVDGFRQFRQMIANARSEAAALLPETNQMLAEYMEKIEFHIDRAASDTMDFLVQSDWNPLNVLWDGEERVVGIVDFESIACGDRIEGLAWLVKWYARTGGVGSHEMSPALAQALLRGYGAEEVLSEQDYPRLRSFLWLTGCLNWHFASRAIELIRDGEDLRLREHLKKYEQRGERLVALVGG